MTFIDDISVTAHESSITGRSQTISDFGVEYTDTELDGEISKTRAYSRQGFSFQGDVEYEDPAEDIIYNRVWINQEIDFDLIVEVEYDSIRIWNAYLFDTATISDFDDPGHTGITVESITPPVILNPNEEAVYDVTVYPTGPANQYSVYTYTVNGANLTCTVIGKRILPFPFPANWEAGFDMTYGYNTSIFSAPTTHEQRRSITNKVRRESNFRVLLSKINAQKFENLFRKGASRFFGVPIYSEIFTTDSTITGQTSITANEDITDFFNLQNLCDQLVIVDHATAKAEIKVISGIASQVITFEVEVIESFSPSSTVIYPIYIGLLNNYNFKNLTDGVIEATVSFTEEFIG